MAKSIALLTALLAVATAGCGSSSKSSGSNGPPRSSESAPAATPAKFPAADGKIAFRRYFNDDQTSGAVFTINPDGTGERQITHPRGNSVDDRPAWSTDGKL